MSLSSRGRKSPTFSNRLVTTKYQLILQLKVIFFLHLQLEKLIAKNYFLNQSAKEAFKSYVRAYDSHQLKQIFDVNTLDLQAVSKSFGFLVPPVVDLKVGAAKRQRPEKRVGGGGFGYYKQMNDSGSKQRVFKQVNRDQAKKFMR